MYSGGACVSISFRTVSRSSFCSSVKAKSIRPRLSRSLLVAPESEQFLRSAVGGGEDHGVGAGFVRVLHPARNDDDVVRFPVEGRAADRRRARALDRYENRAVGSAIGFPLE